jgi:hypothetical protein
MKKAGKDLKLARPTAKDAADTIREAALIAFEKVKAARAKAAESVK